MGTITDVNLTLSNYSHAFPDDVDVMLVSPSGVRVIVMSDVGGGSPLTNVSLVLDDQAAADLPDGTVISAGTYRPTNVGAGDSFTGAPSPTGAGSSLAALNGTDGNGVWSL